MTREQFITLNTLRRRRYHARVVKRVRDGILLVAVKRRAGHGMMPIRIYANGTYDCPWYDTRNTHSRRMPTWHN